MTADREAFELWVAAMELRHLRYFIGVADCGSFSRAANELGIAQPTISRQIATLEGEIGSALFLRGPHGIALTEAGVALREHAHSIIRHADQAIAEASQRAKIVSGGAGIGAPQGITDLIFPDIAKVYKNKYPDVTIRFVGALSAVLNEHLDAGRIDLAILTNLKPSDKYHITPLFSDDVYALASAKFFPMESTAERLKLSDVCHYPLILTSPMNQGRRMLETLAIRTNVKLNVAIESDELTTIKSLVQQGLGLALLPYSTLSSEIKDPNFWCRPIEGIRHERSLVRRKDAPLRRAVSELGRITLQTVRRKFP